MAELGLFGLMHEEQYGGKLFITNGDSADLYFVAAKRILKQ